ncbi:3-keto-L-gulonate-6-phosphate decarboxylase UlaD [Methanosarcinaceae archaeon Ag5]|uniref:3-hexulose-6-phosphate synthase n=1 Tax=Methanolapillus africanus TaxID=3028297 RepID=A0AAE4MIH8_9EURY|nr:3-keto-L-gulonate-6-phosphate decarboxylase UlaD [Methanosarcinaceae archaeon Ag5]
MVLIQVALDLVELDRALLIAQEAVLGGADWIEAGTPLIKSEGMNAVRKLREAFPGKTILADMKTMDAGAVEVEMAAKSGADVVAILGRADDAVISESLESARKYGVRLMVDLISVDDPVARSQELVALGVDLINVHVGIDQQMTGKSPLETLAQISKEIDAEIAVAGGLKPETARNAAAMGAGIVIVGSYIIHSDNVTQSAKEIRQAVDNAGSVPDSGKKSQEDEIFEIFWRVSSSNISDAMHRKGAMCGISTLFPGRKIVGRAVTVRTLGGDWAKPVEAIDLCGKTDVLVIFNSDRNIAMWGGLATKTAVNRGIAGLVVDGAVRDMHEIKTFDLPVFAANVVPNAGDPKGLGEINCEITCGGQIVNPRDFIVADDSGVVVIPKERAYEIARRSEEVWKKEKRISDEIDKGKSMSSVLELLKWEKQK